MKKHLFLLLAVVLMTLLMFTMTASATQRASPAEVFTADQAIATDKQAIGGMSAYDLINGYDSIALPSTGQRAMVKVSLLTVQSTDQGVIIEIAITVSAHCPFNAKMNPSTLSAVVNTTNTRAVAFNYGGSVHKAPLSSLSVVVVNYTGCDIQSAGHLRV